MVDVSILEEYSMTYEDGPWRVSFSNLEFQGISNLGSQLKNLKKIGKFHNRNILESFQR